MDREAGFTLAEMMVALLILSAMAISIAAITGNIIGSWERTETRLEATNGLAGLAGLIQVDERQRKTANGTGPGSASLETDSGEVLALAEPRIERDATCVFDLVGRRCR